MSLLALAIIFAVLIGLSFTRLPMIAWLGVWLVAAWAFLRFAIVVPVPASIYTIYLSLTAVGLLSYILADDDRFNSVKNQFVSFICDKKYGGHLSILVVFLPLALATNIYLKASQEVKAPTFGRTIHPAPPDSINFKGKDINLITADNPYRELSESDPKAFAQHVANGKDVYYQNCVFCHGDDLRGIGIFAHGYSPVPANFNSATTIAMLQESYLFWRIAKGGPGLPDESGPWSSSMPAWEKFLNEEQIWDVILFLYEHTGTNPREREEGH